MPERFSSIEKVVGKGVSEEEKGLFIRRFKEKFDEQKFEKLRGFERKKTPDELKIISFVNEETNKLLEKFGLRKFDIPPENIHILTREKWGEEDYPAIFGHDAQTVVMRENESRTGFAARVFHEMIHFKSGSTLLVKKEGQKEFFTKIRFGLEIPEKGGSKNYFKNLNEGITEQLTKQFIGSLVDNPLFQEEIKETRKIIKQYPQAVAVKEGLFFLKILPKNQAGEPQIFGEWLGYKTERSILNTLINKLFERNKDNFKNRKEIFDRFVEAMLEGNIISLGHLINSTFGKGTMRVIGELDDDIKAQEAYVKAL
jgi:hypothetical protein